MKAYKNLIYIIVSVLLAFAPCASAQSLFDGKKWLSPQALKAPGGGTMQGAAYYNGKIYQFKNAGVTYSIYDVATSTGVEGESLAENFSGTHFGSACFGPESTKTYTRNGVSHNNNLPLLYVTGHLKSGVAAADMCIFVDVIDLEAKTRVMRFQFPHRTDDMIAAYDFAGGHIYLLGYPDGVSSKAPYYLMDYSGVTFTNYDSDVVDLRNATPEITRNIGGPDSDGIQRSLQCGSVQDIAYVDGYLYFCSGRGSNYNRTEWVRINAYDIAQKKVVKTVLCQDCQEAQGFMYDSTNDRFLMTVSGSNRVWIYANGTGYDTYNPEPATEVSTDNYSISNASQLVWFLQQVYAGRTTISAELACDIDMTGVTLPTSYYVYETATDRTFDAQYAFRGTFDGNGHSISGLEINSTPYYNCGLFPYCIGATIQDVKVEGSITLTKATTQYTTDVPVANVGLIGNMNGGTISGVDVSEFEIKNPSGLQTSNVNNLCGAADGVEMSGNTTEIPHTDGDIYVNGVCIATGEHVSLYQEPDLVNGIYRITNAGNLIWFANHVNAGNPSANAILVNDIDMKGSKYGSFPGIGVTTSVVYNGTFDGNGKTISNYYMLITTGARVGMFNNTKGVVKDFTLKGILNITGNNGFYGSVAGELSGGSITDVTSAVDVTITSTNSLKSIGGLVGCASNSSVINRCRYMGTISADANFKNGLGGICGKVKVATISNCLFDGEIISARTANDVQAGGIVGRVLSSGNRAVINNCLEHGFITMSAASNPSAGAVVGFNEATVEVNANTFYTYYEGINLTKAYASASTGTTTCVAAKTTAEGLTDGTILASLGSANWHQGTRYPIPGSGSADDDIYPENSPVPVYEEAPEHVHIYVNGFCTTNDDTVCDCEFEPAQKDTDGYYIIDNGGKLFWFANMVNSTGIAANSNAKLTADIDLDGAGKAANRNFPGIGKSDGSTNSVQYKGVFKGQNHAIHNLYVSVPTSAYRRALFGWIDGATVQDFTVDGYMTLGSTNAMHGTVVGDAMNASVISNVTSSVDLTCTVNVKWVAGIAGNIEGTTRMENCHYSGTLTASESSIVGALCGQTRNTTTMQIKDCVFDGKIIKGGAALQTVNLVGNMATTPSVYTGNTYVVANVVLDDAATTMPSLSTDANIVKAKKVTYSRPAGYMTGYISCCLPFELSADLLPDPSCTVWQFTETRQEDGKTVAVFSSVDITATQLPAGTPCLIKLSAEAEGKAWAISLETSDGTVLVAEPLSSETGLVGSFTTIETGLNGYKLNNTGDSFLKTRDSSHCYPYRAYLKF